MNGYFLGGSPEAQAAGRKLMKEIYRRPHIVTLTETRRRGGDASVEDLEALAAKLAPLHQEAADRYGAVLVHPSLDDQSLGSTSSDSFAVLTIYLTSHQLDHVIGLLIERRNRNSSVRLSEVQAHLTSRWERGEILAGRWKHRMFIPAHP